MQGAWPYMTILGQASKETFQKNIPKHLHCGTVWTLHRSRSKHTICSPGKAGSHPGSVWGQLSAGICELLSESWGNWWRACVKKKDLRSVFLSSSQQSPADWDVCCCTPGVSVFLPHLLLKINSFLSHTGDVNPRKPARIETFSGFHALTWVFPTGQWWILQTQDLL